MAHEHSGLAPHPCGVPGGALVAVSETVAVSVGVVGIDREELVEPAAVYAGMLPVHAFALGVCVAGVCARELSREVEAIVVGIGVGGRATVVRVVAHVELPAIRHAVTISVGAVVLVGVGLAVHRLGDPVGILVCDVRVRGAAAEHALVVALLPVVPQGDVVSLREEERLAHVCVPALHGGRGLVAVLQEQVLVASGVALGVHGRAGAIEEARAGDDGIGLPAPCEESMVVDEPAGARIKLELVVDLVVDERDGLAGRDGEDGRLFGEFDLLGVERQHPGRAAVSGHAHGFGIAVAEHRDGVDRGHAVGELPLVILHGEEVAAVVREGVFAEPVDVDDCVLAVGGVVGHEVAVGVHAAVVGVVGLDGIHAAHDLPEVGEAVAVGVPADRAGAESVFLEVGEAVVVGVALVCGSSGCLRGIERGGDLLGGELLAHGDVVDRELGAAQTVVDAVNADHGAVPEVVLVAVGESVFVRVGHCRVGALFGNPAVGRVEARRPCGHLGGVLRIGQTANRVAFLVGVLDPEVVHAGDRVRLCLGEARHGYPVAAHVAVEAVVVGAHVEAVVEAADFENRPELAAEAGPVLDVLNEGAAMRRQRGQEVLVHVGRG